MSSNLADGCQLFSQGKRQAIETISSGEAEFDGLTDVVLETKPIKDLLEWAGLKVIWDRVQVQLRELFLEVVGKFDMLIAVHCGFKGRSRSMVSR